MACLRPVLVVVVAATWAVAGCSFDSSGLSAAGKDGGPLNDQADASGAGGDGGQAGGPDASQADDRDGDGVADLADNCPETANAMQYDEDDDGVGDECDNCPGTANPDQLDAEEIGEGGSADGVGDACDPRPTQGGDHIAFFDGFNGNTRDPAWKVGAGPDTWSVSGGDLVQSSTNSDKKILYVDGIDLERAGAESRFTLTDVPGSSSRSWRTAGVVAHYDPGDSEGTGYACSADWHLNSNEDATLDVLMFDDSSTTWILGNRADTNQPLIEDMPYYQRILVDGPGEEIDCDMVHPPTNNLVQNTESDNDYSSGHLGLRAWHVAVSYHYVVIYELGGAP